MVAQCCSSAEESLTLDFVPTHDFPAWPLLFPPPGSAVPWGPQPLFLQSEAAADLGLEPHVCFTSRMWVVLGCPFIQLASAVCGSASRPAAAVMAPAPAPAPASLVATAAPSSRHIPHGQLWHPPAWAESPSAFGPWYWVWTALH